MKKVGKITTELGAEPTDNDLRCALFLIKRGFDVKFLRANRQSGILTPDMEINGKTYEVKTPSKSKANTLDHAMKKGLKQAKNLIFDLRKLHSTGAKASRKLQREFQITHEWRELWIITVDKGLLTFKK